MRPLPRFTCAIAAAPLQVTAACGMGKYVRIQHMDDDHCSDFTPRTTYLVIQQSKKYTVSQVALSLYLSTM